MSTNTGPGEPRSEDADARDSLAGDFEKHVDPDIAELDEDDPGPVDEPGPDHR